MNRHCSRPPRSPLPLRNPPRNRNVVRPPPRRPCSTAPPARPGARQRHRAADDGTTARFRRRPRGYNVPVMSYELVEKQVLYKGRKVNLELHYLADEEGKRAQREVVVHRGAVVILPFLDADTILLIRNRRYALGQILTELPAGTLEQGEVPMNCAGRELAEETGYLATRLKPMVNFYPSPGILTEKMYGFVAYDLEKA